MFQERLQVLCVVQGVHWWGPDKGCQSEIGATAGPGLRPMLSWPNLALGSNGTSQMPQDNGVTEGKTTGKQVNKRRETPVCVEQADRRAMGTQTRKQQPVYFAKSLDCQVQRSDVL